MSRDVGIELKGLIEVFQLLDENDLSYYLFDFLDSSIAYVNGNLDQLQPEDWCLCYYILYKYVAKGHEEQSTYEEKLNTLKQYIRFHYMVRYQGKIPLESSFYKILSIVELETFLADDILNYY